jgi:hypothetical protein
MYDILINAFSKYDLIDNKLNEIFKLHKLNESN